MRLGTTVAELFTTTKGKPDMSRQTSSPPHAPSNGATKEKSFNAAFRRIATASANAVGSKWAFLIAALIILIWAAAGPIFHFSDTWQLVINTGTTIVTFLMVFLIQNTQNRDAKAFHLKLDELIRAIQGARNRLVNLEELSDEELNDLQKQFERFRSMAQRRAEQTRATADTAEQKSERARETAERAHDVAENAEEQALHAEQTVKSDRGSARAADRV
jgi:low affinity Fe/Cu permease